MAFRAGDKVKHSLSGEEWILAIDEENGRVSWCGWPEGMAEAKDCNIVLSASDEEREKMLQTWADKINGVDHRTGAASRQLGLKVPRSRAAEAEDLLEAAWEIIANTGHGDWVKESPEWRKAAEEWRDRFHSLPR